MSTRSFIGKLNGDGSITGVYCHFDGYPDGVGLTLQEHYRDVAEVDALLALGDLSELYPTLENTVAYHRDRGEELLPPKVYTDVEQLVTHVHGDMDAEWAYVFHYDGWRNYETR